MNPPRKSNCIALIVYISQVEKLLCIVAVPIPIKPPIFWSPKTTPEDEEFTIILSILLVTP